MSEECQQAFEVIKADLAQLPLLTKPIAGKTLYLYIVVGEHSIRSMLIKQESSIEKPVYFVSKVLQGLETRYIEIENESLAVMTTSRKLRPYFLSHIIKVCTNLAFKQTLGWPDFVG